MIRFHFLNKATIIVIIIYTIVLITVPILLLIKLEPGTIVAVVLYILITIIILFTLFLVFSKTIKINDSGVELSKWFGSRTFKSWNEMKSVTLVYYSPFPVASPARFICFSKKPLHNEVIHTFSSDCIYMRYRPRAVVYLKKYWGETLTQ